MIFGGSDVFSRSVVEGTHSGSKVAFPTNLPRDFVNHISPRAIGVFDWSGFKLQTFSILRVQRVKSFLKNFTVHFVDEHPRTEAS